MTQLVNPSIDRIADSFLTAGSLAYAGLGDGTIIPSAETTELANQSAIDETVLNSFAYSTSTSSLTVNISAGEAFIFGSWVAKDTQTSVTLPQSTTTRVYLGWDANAANSVLIGDSSSFEAGDAKIELAEFVTDGSGVTSDTDLRQFESIDADQINGNSLSELVVDASNNATTVVEAVDDINVSGGLSASADGDGSATIVGSAPYTDSDAINAVNNESSLTVNISGDADTVSGYDFVKNGNDGIGVINFIPE